MTPDFLASLIEKARTQEGAQTKMNLIVSQEQLYSAERMIEGLREGLKVKVCASRWLNWGEYVFTAGNTVVKA